jgi:protein-S-isoprenylcysteine O-methyltransferase Ste14
MWAISGMLLFQHWNIILLDVPTILLTCIDLFKADKNGVERFGDDYKAYMKKLKSKLFARYYTPIQEKLEISMC